MKRPKKIQRPIHIAVETFNKLQKAYLEHSLSKCRGNAKPPTKHEFYTEIIELGLQK